jgi:hypothetical protein
MMRAVALWTFLCAAVNVSAQLYVRIQWTSTTTTNIGARSQAEFRNASFNIDYYWYVYLDCAISGPRTDSNWSSQYGTVSVGCGIVEYLPGWQLPAGCYRGYATGTANRDGQTVSQGAGTSQYCIEGSSTPPPSTEPADKCDGSTGYNQPCSPIVINLANGPWVLSGVEDPVHFDIDADGTREWITWLGRGEPLAFLALDRNANGNIDNGAELFGTATPLQSRVTAANGFEALKDYDANMDGVVDDRDPVWPRLLLWQDSNHNGVAEPNEISDVAATGVTGLHTFYRETRRTDSNGNAFRYIGLLVTNAGRRPFYDVLFRLAH